ncbi:WGR domain-containing protein [Mesorhizobium sp. ANAO-SY3R2]|uniref:WGR domain-containing protein n=1 Tax=Mesorhizobium sp. ANAO-SY3R2 TaxID=3166644 RepID=UPI0036733682
MLHVMEPINQPHHFRRIDASRNMARFYVLSVEPMLFGGASMLRHWGRIGTRGHQKIELFDNASEATAALGKLASAKRKRGYA